MMINEETWSAVQQYLGFNDGEMVQFKADPRNVDVLNKFPEMQKKEFEATARGRTGTSPPATPYMRGFGRCWSISCPRPLAQPNHRRLPCVVQVCL